MCFTVFRNQKRCSCKRSHQTLSLFDFISFLSVGIIFILHRAQTFTILLHASRDCHFVRKTSTCSRTPAEWHVPLISLWGGITPGITFEWHLKLRFGATGLWEARISLSFSSRNHGCFEPRRFRCVDKMEARPSREWDREKQMDVICWAKKFHSLLVSFELWRHFLLECVGVVFTCSNTLSRQRW